MKKTKYSVLLLASLLTFTACSKDEREPQGGASTEQTTTQGRTLTLSTSIAELPEEVTSAARSMTFGEDVVARKTKFIFKEGDRIPLYVVFKQGNISKASPKPATLVIQERKSAKLMGLAEDIEVPAGIDLSQSFDLAGAIGVESINDQGEAVVPAPTTLYEGLVVDEVKQSGYYTIPMYFTKQSVTLTGKNGSYLGNGFELKLYGSFLRLNFNNVGESDYALGEVELKSKGLSTEGTMGLLNLQANADFNGAEEPSWTPMAEKVVMEDVRTDKEVEDGKDLKLEPKTYPVTTSLVRVEQGKIPVRQAKNIYVWVKPTSKQLTKLTVDVRRNYTNSDILYSLGAEQGDSESHHNLKPIKDDHKVHGGMTINIPKIEYDLIFSEVYMGQLASQFAWEVYNPTDHDIDLTQYYKVKELNGRRYVSKLIDLKSVRYRLMIDNREEDRGYYAEAYHDAALPQNGNRYLGETKYTEWILAPGETALWVAGTGVIVYQRALMRERSAYKQNRFKNALKYLIEVADPGLEGILEPQELKAFKVENGSKHWLAKKSDGSEIVDVFFKFADGVPQPDLPSATFMRKPYRDMPRKEMKLLENSDWVWRKPTESVDWGRRYSYAWDYNSKTPHALARTADYYIWIDYKSENAPALWKEGKGYLGRQGFRNIRPTKYVSPKGTSGKVLRTSAIYYAPESWTYSVWETKNKQVAH